MAAILPMILDIFVILFLAGTIFYAIRLSAYIKIFKESRHDLGILIKDLSSHIKKAEQAIQGLQESARQSGRNLQSQINDAQGLIEELQIMTQSGNNLANRLEKTVEKSNRKHHFHSPSFPEKTSFAQPPQKNFFSEFSIRDPDFDDHGNDLADDSDFSSMNNDDEDNIFESRAERELYDALQKKSKVRTGGITS